jgi:tetratricopeptide (TPR) repeat protein
LALTIATPFLFLFLLEIGLRVARYGPDLSVFTTQSFGSRHYWVINPGVKSRYFSRVEFSPNTSFDCFSIPKPRGTFRIFCLGGSTTVGYPYGFVGSFSTFLRDRLHRLFPDRQIEVINLGLTATNSFTVNDLADEVASLEPDLLIVYDGHNEFYGALGAASQESAGGARWLTKAYLRVVHYKTFLLLRDAYSWLHRLVARAEGEIPTGTMMERLARGQYVPYGSPMYRKVLENFRANLEELTDLVRRRHIPLILGTQVSNLRDQPPFVSVIPPSASHQDSLFLSSITHGSSVIPGSPESISHDTLFAPLHAALRYAIARGLDRSGRTREALSEYILARDYDELRFRCTSDFNDAILSAGHAQGAAAVDFEEVFAAHSPDSLIGRSLVLEHLHPNSRGYFLMAKSYASAMCSLGLLASPQEWARRDTIPDESLWLGRPLTDLDSLCAGQRISLLTSGWPFRDSAVAVTPPSGNGLPTIAWKMVLGSFTWEEGHVAAADWYAARGDTTGALREYRALINQTPMNISPYLRMGKLYADRGDTAKAECVLRQSLAVERSSFALRTLGAIDVMRGQTAPALTLLTEALPLCGNSREIADTRFVIAVAWARAGNRDKALDELDRIFAMIPDHPAGRQLERALRGPR